MMADIATELARSYRDAGGKNRSILDIIPEKARDERSWGWSCYGIDSDLISIEDIDLLLTCANSDKLFTDTPGKRQDLRKLRAVLKAKKDGGRRITNLEVMCEAIKEYLAPLPNHWVFTDVDGQMVPWHVDGVTFHPKVERRDGVTPAYVSIYLKAKNRGRECTKTITFGRDELGNGTSAPNLLGHLGIMPETEELLEQYGEAIETYYDYRMAQAEQFLICGWGKTGPSDVKGDDVEDRYRYWSRDNSVELGKAGATSKAIMDDGVGFGGKRNGSKREEEVVYANRWFWKGVEDADDVSDEVAASLAPVHPYLCVFSLAIHEFVIVHVGALIPYAYDADLGDKLVLPSDHLRMIRTLMGTKDRSAEDIVRGKRGGIIILCSGAPGTGKTLTSEVFAEMNKRPLYTVQCSQLGISAEALEKSLGVILQRAVRWSAVLLIDEADVYIHERGNDINQNAVVGVFLRMLEHYSGVLFLTTNRESVVDDAIMSRCIAHIRYQPPQTEDEKRRIWSILSRQYKVMLDDDIIERLIIVFPTISGRGIKQLCRLAQTMGEPPTVKLFKWLASFQDGIEIKDRPRDG